MRYLGTDTAKPISAIGLGTWQFGSAEWGYGAGYAGGTAAAIVRRAVELGVTLFDTAEVYARGRSEVILGAALREADADPARTFLATKILPVFPVSPVVQQRAVGSAARLQVRSLDLYQVHQPNPLVPDGTTMHGMRALQTVGLVSEVGVSNYSLARWRHAEAALGSRVLSNQVHYNLVHRAPDLDLVPYAREHNRLVIAYSPLAQGLLSGRYHDGTRTTGGIRALNRHFSPENLRRSTPLVAALREVADAHDATPSQVALAWVIRSPCVAAIPGASSVEQLESNVRAAGLALADDEVAALATAADAYAPESLVASLAARASRMLDPRK